MPGYSSILSTVSNSSLHLSKICWLIYDWKIRRFLNIICTILNCCCKKVYIPVSICLLWISLMKLHCPMWRFFSDLTQQHISGEDYANAHSGTCSIFKHGGTVTIYARSVRSFPIIGHVPEFSEAVYTVLWIRLCTLCYCTQSSLASFSLNGPAIPRIVRICWYASYGSTYHSRST